MYSPHVLPARAIRAARSAHRSSLRRSTNRLRIPAGENWQQVAVAAYHESAQTELAALRQELAQRVAALTGRHVAPATIYADRDARLAVLNLDGVVFRLRGHELALIRRCVHCNTGHFESPALTSRAELGHALDAWEPRCDHCVRADPEAWLETT